MKKAMLMSWEKERYEFKPQIFQTQNLVVPTGEQMFTAGPNNRYML